MLRHIVFFTAAPGADRDAVRAGLKLLEANPHARFIEVGDNLNVDTISSGVDFVVYAEFPDEAALAAYKAHPLYQQSIDSVRPIRELRIAADFVSRAAAS